MQAQIRRLLEGTGDEITDGRGRVVGYVAQPARFQISRPYLARGGFLVVVRDEQTGEYVGSEFDALPHPNRRGTFPGGHSQMVFRVAALNEACKRVMAYYADAGVQQMSTQRGGPAMVHQETKSTQPHRTIDLRGDVCPLTFAKTKIALEEMEVGQILRVLLDYEPASRNVPRSAELYGDEILLVGTMGAGQWQILIRKRVQ